MIRGRACFYTAHMPLHSYSRTRFLAVINGKKTFFCVISCRNGLAMFLRESVMKMRLVRSVQPIVFAGLIVALGVGGWLKAPAVADTLVTESTCSPAADASDLTTTSALMLLSPEGMAQTITTQPTFFWLSQETSTETPTLFRLYEYDDVSETYMLLMEGESNAERNEAGIMALTLPQDMATLSVGGRYLWQVEVACDRDAANSAVAAAEFEVVEPSVKMMDDLIAASTTAERTNILATESLWYDALSTMFLVASTEDASQDMADVRRMLFEQVATSTNEQAQLESSPVIRQDLVLIPIR